MREGDKDWMLEPESMSTHDPQTKSTKKQSSMNADNDDHGTETVKESQEIEINEEEINDNDVLCGRGNAINRRSGNRRFRALIRHFIKKYKSTDDKEIKTTTVSAIVEAVRNANPPGRFLKKHPSKDNVWYEIGDRKAWDKTSQSLRDLYISAEEQYSLGHKEKQPKQRMKCKYKTGMFLSEQHQTMQWLQERDSQFQMMRRKLQQQQQLHQLQQHSLSEGQGKPQPNQSNGLTPLLSVQKPPPVPPQNMNLSHHEKILIPSMSRASKNQVADTSYHVATSPPSAAAPVIETDLTALGDIYASKYDKFTRYMNNPHLLLDTSFNEEVTGGKESISDCDEPTDQVSNVKESQSVLQHEVGLLHSNPEKKQTGQNKCCKPSHSAAKQSPNKQEINDSKESSLEDSRTVKRKETNNAYSSEGKLSKRHKVNQDDKTQLSPTKIDNLKNESHQDVLKSIETQKVFERQNAQNTSPSINMIVEETETCGCINAFTRSSGTQTHVFDSSMHKEEELKHFSGISANRSVENLTNQRRFNELQAVLIRAQKETEAYDGEFLLDQMSLMQELQKWNCVPIRSTVETLQAHMFGHLFYSYKQRPSCMSSLLDKISDENKIPHWKVIHLAALKILSQSRLSEKYVVD